LCLTEENVPMPQLPSRDDAIERRARTIRRVGYPLLAIIGAWIVISLIVSAIIGLLRGEIKDPMRSQPHPETVERCERWGQQLIDTHQHLDGTERVDWQLHVDGWRARCATAAPSQAEALAPLEQPVEVPR